MSLDAMPQGAERARQQRMQRSRAGRGRSTETPEHGPGTRGAGRTPKTTRSSSPIARRSGSPVFCSAPGLNCQIEASARQHVHLRDRDAAEGQKPRDGIIAALTGLTPGEHADHRQRVDTPMAKAVSRAMEQAGVRRAQKYRRVGDYGLARLLFEGPNYQDWEATHVSVKNISRRIRIYPLAGAVGAEARQTTVRAAAREFQILEGISHPGILRAVDYAYRGSSRLYRGSSG